MRKDFAQALKALNKLADKLQYAGTLGEDKMAEVKKGVVDKCALLDSVKKWQQAKQIIEPQLTQLLAALRSSDVKCLSRVADQCEAVGAGLKQYDAALATVVQKVTQAPGDEALKKSALAGREVIGKYEKYLQGTRLIEACEHNPLTEVSIRLELGVVLRTSTNRWPPQSSRCPSVQRWAPWWLVHPRYPSTVQTSIA